MTKPAPASDLIAAFNAGREPERLAMKYAAMRADPFRFLRGTCHLFHIRMSQHGLAPDGPAAWICGDLHLENVGTYLGDNGLTYFDVNDFDEAILAPVSWDILRLAVSVLAAAPSLGLTNSSAKTFAKDLIGTYFAELSLGKPRWLERSTASGPIGDLMDKRKRRDPAKFLAKRTVTKGGKTSLLIDGERTLAISKPERTDLAAFMAALAKQNPDAKPLKFVDAARRIAGTGSLGVPRFVILVKDPTNSDSHWLLDLKSANPSALAPYVATKQPKWPSPNGSSEAARVAAIQTLFQANTPSMLSAQTFDGAPYTLKQMQPSADRLDLKALASSKDDFGHVITAMARLTAWGHLRGTGHQGSPAADDLIAAAGDPKAPADLLERALALDKINSADWSQYCAAYDQGTFGPTAKAGPGEQ
ncbi:MAG: DUF2252 family protein [Hyphomicrobiaceae bacterium]